MSADPFDTPVPTGRPEPKRDRWQRYLLPDPQDGKEIAWTRATTFAKSIADTMALNKWSLRMAIKGLATRTDLYALAAAASLDDRDKLDRIAEDAKEAAAASSGANLGTALHAFTENLDRGEPGIVPDPWAADVTAYQAAMQGAGITPLREYVEQIVVVRSLRVAGTLDRIIRLADGTLAIGDLKTGKDLSYSWGEIAIQLALYANADAMWNPDTGRYEPMPDVDHKQAIVMHLPVGKANCQLHAVDITAGWAAAELCAQVRAWRTKRGLATPWPPPPVVDPVHRSVDTSALLDRIKKATSETDLVALWEQATAAGTWTTAHTAAAARRKQHLSAAPA